MVAFAMEREDCVAVLKDVIEKHPPPDPYFPQLFGCFVQLLGLTTKPRAIEKFADECGLLVLVKVQKLDKGEPVS
jgi:hypothetical protein